MTPRRWQEQFEKRLADADAGLRAREPAHRRDIQGVATLHEYELLYCDMIPRVLLRLVPLLTVVRAARRAQVSPGATLCPDIRLVITVLSYLPTEELPQKLEARVEELRNPATGVLTDPTDRAVAAVAYLTLGSTTGKGRRQQVWNAGLPQAEAARTWLDLDDPHHKELLHRFEPFWREIGRQHLEQSGEVLNAADGWPCFPLDAVAGGLDDGLWSGHERPEADTSGHGTKM